MPNPERSLDQVITDSKNTLAERSLGLWWLPIVLAGTTYISSFLIDPHKPSAGEIGGFVAAVYVVYAGVSHMIEDFRDTTSAITNLLAARTARYLIMAGQNPSIASPPQEADKGS